MPTRAADTKPGSRSYHHGDLAAALLRAAEIVLRRDGIDALSLRAVAREAGVSHTAPKHHFDDLTGLLSELAAVGFARFRDTMLAAAQRTDDPSAQGGALGRGYLDFARRNPDLFLLMFRSTRLDMRRPALQQAADEAFAVLAQSRGVAATSKGVSLKDAAGIAGAWAFVHGLALLAIDGRLKPIVDALPRGVGEDALLAATIDGSLTQVRPPRRA